jgi:3-hydroxypropanoate dehydrogenase
MAGSLSEAALDQLLREARTHSAWLDRPVPEALLRELWELMKWGPTSMNGLPARLVFLCTPAAKERLRPALSPGNVEKTMQAPVTVILAYDLGFFEQLPRLFPHSAGGRDLFAGSPELAEVTAFRNGTLQAGYFILAARSLGLDCGPMSGFDNARVDADFFSAQGAAAFAPPAQVRSSILCNLGYGDPAHLHPRGPRLSFAEACRLL